MRTQEVTTHLSVAFKAAAPPSDPRKEGPQGISFPSCLLRRGDYISLHGSQGSHLFSSLSPSGDLPTVCFLGGQFLMKLFSHFDLSSVFLRCLNQLALLPVSSLPLFSFHFLLSLSPFSIPFSLLPSLSPPSLLPSLLYFLPLLLVQTALFF